MRKQYRLINTTYDRTPRKPLLASPYLAGVYAHVAAHCPVLRGTFF